MTKQKFKLTYSDAIKALDCCCSIVNDCKQCPVYVVGGTCCSSSILAHFLRDFIERQKAENERLQKILIGFMDEVGTWSNKYDVDISNIHKLPLLAKEDWNIRNKIKAEAIKEFIQEHREIMMDFRDDDDQISLKLCEYDANTNNLAKEITGR